MCVSVCVYIYMCVYVCVCIYMCVYVCVCIYMCVYVCVCIYMCVYVCIPCSYSLIWMGEKRVFNGRQNLFSYFYRVLYVCVFSCELRESLFFFLHTVLYMYACTHPSSHHTPIPNPTSSPPPLLMGRSSQDLCRQRRPFHFLQVSFVHKLAFLPVKCLWGKGTSSHPPCPPPHTHNQHAHAHTQTHTPNLQSVAEKRIHTSFHSRYLCFSLSHTHTLTHTH